MGDNPSRRLSAVIRPFFWYVLVAYICHQGHAWCLAMLKKRGERRVSLGLNFVMLMLWSLGVRIFMFIGHYNGSWVVRIFPRGYVRLEEIKERLNEFGSSAPSSICLMIRKNFAGSGVPNYTERSGIEIYQSFFSLSLSRFLSITLQCGKFCPTFILFLRSFSPSIDRPQPSRHFIHLSYNSPSKQTFLRRSDARYEGPISRGERKIFSVRQFSFSSLSLSKWSPWFRLRLPLRDVSWQRAHQWSMSRCYACTYAFKKAGKSKSCPKA